MGSAEATETETAQPLTLEEAQAWAGHRLDEISGGSVGRVEGAVVDTETGRPEWLLARMGRFGHHTLVPARDAVEGVGHVWVPYTRDQIRRAPKIERGSSINRETEQQLLAHYRMAGDAGRFAELQNRDAEAVTARPA